MLLTLTRIFGFTSLALLTVESLSFAEPTLPSSPQTPIAELTSKKPASKLPAQVKNLALALGKIDIEVENELTIITAKLSRLPDWKDLQVEDHGTFLQIKIPQTSIPTSGEFFDGNGPYLKKIATFEVGDTDGAIRLFLNQDASKVKLATSAEVLGERVVITIDHKKLEQLLQPVKENDLKSTPVVATKSATLDQEASKVNTVSTPALETKDAKAAEPAIGSGPEGLNLKEKLITAAIFCALLLIFLVGSTIWRTKRLKNLKISRALDHIEPASMRILNNISISNRQKLSLVQVGSQQILIGISPENISFLTNVESHHKPTNSQNFNHQLLNANPNAEVKLKQVETSSARPQRRPSESSTVSKSRERTEQPSQGASRINYGVGDEGISDMRGRGQKVDKGSPDQPYDDITKIIRDRLRNLPPSP